MKRFIVACCSVAFAASAFVIAPSPSYAEGVRNNTGCGLGHLAFQNVKKDSILIQVVAATLNGICGNQTFGITSGTLGCDKPASFVENEKLQKFVAKNMDTLAHDIAVGDGEAIAALAELMDVPKENRAEFYSALQANFNTIYASVDVQSADVIDSIAGIASKS